MKQAKLHWLKNPSQKNEDSLNNVRREISRILEGKKDGIFERKKKLMNLKQAVRTKISETYIDT
jgi:hypothetical protein